MLKNELNIDEPKKNVTCPIGLNLGGSTPKEIAIDSVAQLLQIHYNQNNNK
jgi:xanthine dehydrogenase accessory factor